MRERAKNRGREGNVCAHARQLVGALRGRLGHRPLFSRRARAVAQSSRAPFSISPTPARRCRSLGGGETRRARVTFFRPPSRRLSHRACAGECGGSGCRLPVCISCQLVGRSSRRPSPSPLSGGGAVESAPRIPRWGRSGDGGSGITEQERERPQAPIPCGGHGRPSPRPQPGRHRPVCPAGERAAPQPRPGSCPCRSGASSCTPPVLPGHPLRHPGPLRRNPLLSSAPQLLCPCPLLPFFLHLLQILGASSVPTLWCPAPTLSYHLYLCSGSGPPSSKVFEGQALAPLKLRPITCGIFIVVPLPGPPTPLALMSCFSLSSFWASPILTLQLS